MTDAIILPNAGSASLKFGAYGVDATKTLPLLCCGQIDSMRGDPHFVVKDKKGRPLDVHAWGEARRSITRQPCRSRSLGWNPRADIKVVAVHADADGRDRD